MVPEGWKLSSLGEVCGGELQTGPFGSQLHAREYIDSGTAVLMPKDLINGKADMLSAAKISASRANSLTKHRLEVGDLLFSRRGDVGRTAMITPSESDSLCGTGCLRARPSSEHHPQFLAYFLQRRQTKLWLEQNAVGQTMLNMNASILSELPLLLPPLPEQQKIARILSTWDTAIETVEKLIENSKAQKKALMQQLLTGKCRFAAFQGDKWESVKISALVNIFYGKSPKDILAENGRLPVLGTGGATGKTSTYMHRGPAVILGRKGTIDKPYYVDTPFWAIDTTFFCLPTQRCDIKCFFYLMNSVNLKKYNEASGVPSLSRETIYNIRVLAPHKKEQEKIAATLTSCDRETSSLKGQLHCLQQQKKALMQQLLTGKRRVKIDPEAEEKEK